MKALPHKFKTSEGIENLGMMVGYMKCLADITDYLKIHAFEIYVYKPDLQEVIRQTSNELMKLKNMDDIQTTLNELTKNIENE